MEVGSRKQQSITETSPPCSLDVTQAKKSLFDSRAIALLPNELVVKILSELGTSDIIRCSLVNSVWKGLIDRNYLQEQAFYRSCHPLAPSPNAKNSVKRYNSSVCDWLKGFSNSNSNSNRGKALVEQLDECLDHKHFPEILFSSVAKILTETTLFTCQKNATLKHDGPVNHVSFSPNGHYLVTASDDGTAQIWGLVDGQWQKKATVQHADGVKYASFSPAGESPCHRL